MMVNTNIDWVQMTDGAIVQQIGRYLKQARLGLNKTQQQVAEDAGLNRWTISQVENGESVTLTSLLQVLRALDALHVLDNFRITEQISPLAYAKLKKEQRERARNTKNKSTHTTDDLGW